MPGKTVNSAISLLVIGNAMAVLSDVMVKLLEPDAPIFQFTFLRCLLTLLLLLPLARKIDHRQLFTGAGLHAFRAHVHLIGMLCMVIALANLPLATANAVFYGAPILVMLLSVVIFRERLTALSVIAIFSGFAGIILILKPIDFNWAALAALGTAVCLAINTVLVRKLPRQQTTVHKLFLNYLLIMPAASALALWDWQQGSRWSIDLVIIAAGSALFILGYNITALLAYRQVDANQVTSAEYTGLIWAIAIGWVWYNEVPDGWLLAGSLMIVIPLVLIGLNQRRKYPARGFNPAMRDSKNQTTQATD